MKVQKVKLLKGVTQEFVDGVAGQTTDQLKALVVQLQLQNQENEEFKASKAYVEEQEAYAQAKDRFDLVAGPVRETTTSLKNRTKLVIERLIEKGGGSNV